MEDGNEPNAKRLRSSSESDGNQNAAAVAPNYGQVADIFKLDIDCFVELFDYLPFEDLVSIGKTCKRLQQMAAHCFLQHYSAKNVLCSKRARGICVGNNNVNHFAPFVHKISISKRDVNFFRQNQSKFSRVTEMTIANIRERAEFEGVQETLNKLKDLILSGCRFRDDFHDHVLSFCLKIEYLTIFRSHVEIDWSIRKYPTLQRFKFIPLSEPKIEGITQFLEINPNIKAFATDLWWFLENQDSMKTSNIELDEFVLEAHLHNSCHQLKLRTCFRLLNELYQRGFYKRLKLSIIALIDQNVIDDLVSLNGLDKLHLQGGKHPLVLPELENLEELRITRSKNISNWTSLPTKLINLKKIHIVFADFDDISILIREVLKLKKIKIDHFLQGDLNKINNIINLSLLEGERAKLPHAQRVTLYVEEEVYLATKWILKESDLQLVHLKRKESCKWTDDLER